MPPTPIDDHTDEFEQLAALQALDLLEGEELARFEQHAAHCGRCHLMVRLDREALARVAPEMDPSPGFKARLMQRAAAELARDSAPTEPIALRRQPENVIAFWRRSRWASALAAVLVLGLITVGGYSYQNQVVASYALTGSLRGSAVVNVRRSGTTELDMNGVQDPPPGFVYEAWLIPPNGKPIPVDVTSSGNAQMSLKGLSNGTVVAITEERSRVDAPTSNPVMTVVYAS